MNIKIKTAAEKALQKNENVLFAFLFGSKAKNSSRFESDLDIAVYFEHEPEILEIGAMILEIEKMVNCKVDLVSLNNLDKLNPTLSYSILNEGILISLKDQSKYKQFKKSIMLQYFDFKPVSELFNKKFYERIAEKKFAVMEK